MVLVGKPEGKSPLGRPCISGDTLKMNTEEIGWDDMDWINLASIKCREFVRTLLHVIG